MSVSAPGGTRIDEGDKAKVTEHCVFTTEENHANLRRYAQVGTDTQTDGHTYSLCLTIDFVTSSNVSQHFLPRPGGGGDFGLETPAVKWY